MNGEHTPGPWRTQECSHGGLILLRGNESVPLSQRHPQSHLQVMPEADATLMSAAPELLAAAEDALEQCSDVFDTPRGDKLRAAIAKARGR